VSMVFPHPATAMQFYEAVSDVAVLEDCTVKFVRPCQLMLSTVHEAENQSKRTRSAASARNRKLAATSQE
jgi:hypothetical protein